MQVLLTRTPTGHFTGHLRIHADGAGDLDREALSLRVEDATGRRVYASLEPGPLTCLPLAAGTYRVTARRGEDVRDMTMSLGAREHIDLHVRVH